VTSAAGTEGFPRDRLGEVALVGRSNVGKSSLINALVGRPLARTSAAPGKTRLANFYRVQRGAAPALYLVDLPGYGYARGGGAFDVLTAEYFGRCGAPQPLDRLGVGPSNVEGQGGALQQTDARRAGLHGPPKPIGVILLVDARHPGLESDLEAWKWLQGMPCPSEVIGTKVDKLTRAERVRHTKALESSFERPVPLISAATGEGLEELWKLIVRLTRPTAA
jgi:GTP-binding protein